MSRAIFAGILLGVILALYGIQKYFTSKKQTPKEKKKETETFVDASGSTLDGSGNDLNFSDLFAKFLNTISDKVKFTPANELDAKTISITTPELDKINANMQRQMTPMISQGIDALRAASAAQNNY